MPNGRIEPKGDLEIVFTKRPPPSRAAGVRSPCQQERHRWGCLSPTKCKTLKKTRCILTQAHLLCPRPRLEGTMKLVLTALLVFVVVLSTLARLLAPGWSFLMGMFLPTLGLLVLHIFIHDRARRSPNLSGGLLYSVLLSHITWVASILLQYGLAPEKWRAPTEEPGGVLCSRGNDRRRSSGEKLSGSR